MAPSKENKKTVTNEKLRIPRMIEARILSRINNFKNN